jgi:hypothetical protein
VRQVRVWAEGRTSSFDPKADLEPLLQSGLSLPEALPVNQFARWLAAHVKGRRPVEIRAIASLFQTNLEVERDGDRLQELFAFYAGLGLPVYLGQLGLPGSDADFLAMGRELEAKSCASPIGLSAAECRSPAARTGTGARRTWESATRRCSPGSCSKSRM